TTNLVIYEATVVTGLEQFAAEEVKEKFGDKVLVDHGRIWIHATTHVFDLLKLRSVDNLYVVIADESVDQLPKDVDELALELGKLMAKCDWQTGIDVWQQVSKF